MVNVCLNNPCEQGAKTSGLVGLASPVRAGACLGTGRGAGELHTMSLPASGSRPARATRTRALDSPVRGAWLLQHVVHAAHTRAKRPWLATGRQPRPPVPLP